MKTLMTYIIMAMAIAASWLEVRPHASPAVSSIIAVERE